MSRVHFAFSDDSTLHKNIQQSSVGIFCLGYVWETFEEKRKKDLARDINRDISELQNW